MKILFVNVIVFALVIGLFSLVSRHRESMVIIGPATFAVTVADSLDERLRGLSGREGLAEGEGMWFIFDRPGTHAMWMKDMRFSIDVLWLDDGLRVIDVKEQLSPETYPEVFKPKTPARYVLEVVAGAIERYGLQIGDQARFSP